MVGGEETGRMGCRDGHTPSLLPTTPNRIDISAQEVRTHSKCKRMDGVNLGNGSVSGLDYLDGGSGLGGVAGQAPSSTSPRPPSAASGGGGAAASSTSHHLASASHGTRAATKHLLLSPNPHAASLSSLAAGSGAGSAGNGNAGGGGGRSVSGSASPLQIPGSSASSSSMSNYYPARSASPAGTAAGGASSEAAGGGLGAGGPQSENDKVYWLIVELLSPQTREAALLELSKKREQWDDLALVLWHSFGGRGLR